jgi:hypothetical protein
LVISKTRDIRDSSFGTEAGYRLIDRGVGAYFRWEQASQTALGSAQPITEWVPGVSSPGNKPTEARKLSFSTIYEYLALTR